MTSSPRWLPPIAGLPRAYWFLWAGTLVNKLGGFVVPFLAIYLTQERGLSVESAGITASLFGAGSLASGVVGGYLADRVGRRSTLTFSATAGAAAMLVLGFARAPLAIAFAGLALGFLGDMYRPASQAMIADLVPPADRPRAYGFQYWAINLGFSIAPVVAGLVAGAGYTILFVADAATTLAFAAIVRFNVPETKPAMSTQHEPAARESWTRPYRHRTYLAFLALTFVVSLVFQQAHVALPVAMARHGISARAFGFLIGINGVLIVVFQPFAVALVQRFRHGRVLAVSALLVGVGFGATALVGAPLGYAVTIAIWTFGEIGMSPMFPTVVSELAPQGLRGNYQGALQLAFGGAMMLAPVLGAAVLGRFGAPALWSACAVAGVAAALGFFARDAASLYRFPSTMSR